MREIGMRIAAAVMLLSALSYGQLDRGTITGTVKDVSGAVVPNTHITIKNTATNATYNTATTGAGDYTAVNLPSGTYQLTFDAPGLKKLVRSNVVVAVSETIRVDASLQVGESRDTVTVTADAEVLQFRQRRQGCGKLRHPACPGSSGQRGKYGNQWHASVLERGAD